MMIDGKFHDDVALPHGLSHKQLKRAMQRADDAIAGHQAVAGDVPLYIHWGKKQMSGVLSNLMEFFLDAESDTLVRNTLDGGFPDLLPIGEYKDNKVKIGRGLEVKTTGLQELRIVGHNAEDTWIIVFHYDVHPFRFHTVYVAKLVKSDWKMTERNGMNRITPSARVRKKGTDKLRAGKVYTTA